LPEIIEKTNFNFIYFDGNHQKEATLNYFNMCLQTVDTNAVFIFDDIYWNKEMHETWEIIKQHPKVTVTINTYFWGIVFFRNEQLKQHFTIRV
jgi:predicted O-methyltransferase YrrM